MRGLAARIEKSPTEKKKTTNLDGESTKANHSTSLTYLKKKQKSSSPCLQQRGTPDEDER
jgi:hypothetical protein